MSIASTINISDLLLAVNSCHSSYNDLVDPVPAFKALGFDQVYYIAEKVCVTKQWLPMNDEVECVAYFCVNHSTKTCFLVFRGTGSWNDLKDDLKFIKLKTEQGKFVHRGFNDRYMALKTPVEQMVYKALPNSYRLIVTGHSLGGVMVTLFLLNASPELIERVTAAYTFGQPRVGGKRVAAYINSLPVPYYRYVNKGDIITKIPMINYYHCGKQIKINGYGFSRSKTETILMRIPCLFNHRVKNYLHILTHKYEER